MRTTGICRDCKRSKIMYSKGLCRKCCLKLRVPPEIEERIKTYQGRAAKRLPLFTCEG